MESLKRKSEYVQELIAHFDSRLLKCNNDVAAVRASLTPSEKETLSEELAKVSRPDPASVRYFLEEYFVINTKGGSGYEDDEMAPQELRTMYPFMEPQEVFWEDFEFCWNHKLPTWWILLKARQIGWSTLVQALLFHRVLFNKNMSVLVIADELTRTQNIYDKSLLAYNHLPFWMRPEKQYDNRGKGITKFDRKDEEERILRPGLNSAFYTDAANKPSGSSRGFTLHGLHASEFGLFLRPKILTQDIIPALAKKNPLVVAAVEGTADEGHNKTYNDMWESAMAGKGVFRPLFAGWWKERTYCKPFRNKQEEDAFVLSPEERDLCSKVKEDMHFDIRKDQMNWYREQADQFESTEGDREMIEQEYPSYPQSAFRSGGICAFPRTKLKRILTRDVRTPIWWGEITFYMDGTTEKAKFHKYGPFRDSRGNLLPGKEEQPLMSAPLWIWEWPVNTDIYYEASDPAQGIPDRRERTDFSTAQIFRAPRRQGERIRQCLEFKGYVDPKTLSKIVCHLGHIYNTCEMAPECNTLTEHIHNILQIHKYPKVYRWRRQDRVTGHWTNFFGWETNMKSREDIIARFKSLLLEDSVELKSYRLLDEASKFIDVDGSGRFEAARDTHDDCLFAAMICVYCLMELDPRLFKMVDETAPDPRTHDFVNTDYSLNDKETQNMDTDFACL